MLIYLTAALFCIEAAQSTLIEREYKVNRIVYLKNHYSWCQVTPIQQIITSPGYQSMTINNNVCVGACWSYSIPKTQPAEPGEIIGPYCDSCQPNVTKCYHVTLNADDANVAGPKTIQKRVEIIENCHCGPCDQVSKVECDLSEENTSELPLSMYTNKEPKTTTPAPDQPDKDMMFFFPKMNANLIAKLLNDDANGPSKRPNVTSKLFKILNVWDRMPNKTDPEKVNKVLPLTQDLDKNELNDLVNVFNSGDTENSKAEDMQKLTKFLEKYQKDSSLTRGRNIWLGTPNNEKILEDLRKSQLPPSYGIESTHGIKHHDDHKDVGISTNEVDNLQVVIVPSTTEEPKTETSPVSHPGSHHISEEELVNGRMEHMVKGPHGSLVLRPDIQVEKKLNIETDSLIPNQKDVVITYTGSDQNKPKLIDD